MKREEILEGNELIAKFMGYTKSVYDHGMYGKLPIWVNDSIEEGHYLAPWEFDYDHNWNSLMPVVEKIETDLGWELIMYSNDCFWNKFGDRPEGLEYEFNGNRRSAVYLAVVEFIKWYNKIKV